MKKHGVKSCWPVKPDYDYLQKNGSNTPEIPSQNRLTVYCITPSCDKYFSNLKKTTRKQWF